MEKILPILLVAGLTILGGCVGIPKGISPSRTSKPSDIWGSGMKLHAWSIPLRKVCAALRLIIASVMTEASES